MTVAAECSIIVGGNNINVEVSELRRILETGNETARISAMKSAVSLLSSGHAGMGPALLMTIIRFVLPNQKNKLLKKLVLLFVELVPKLDNEGRLLSEMILLCNALRNDLQHPNEYVRGVTLRFLTRIREAEILEPLLPSVRACLEHRHAYVRRNAIFAILSIYQTNDFLIPDAPEVVQALMSTETDAACQRNAFIMLSHTDPARAAQFFDTLNDQICTLDPLLQLAIIEFIRADSARFQENVARNVKSIVNLLESNSTVVQFEAATALMQLSNSPVAIRAVANCYIELAVKETDNNAKLMVLDRFKILQQSQGSVVNEMILDVLRVLGASDLAVKQRALEILMSGVTARHASDLVSFLVKELGRLSDYDRASEYKQTLLAAIDVCAFRFPPVNSLAIDCFVELLKDADATIVHDAIRYAKVILDRNPPLRIAKVAQFLDILENSTTNANAAAGLLWIIGEFSNNFDEAFATLTRCIGQLPIVEVEEKARLVDESDNSQSKTTNLATRKLNPDGTYATETALTTVANGGRCSDVPILREFILAGQYGVAVALGATLTKLALQSQDAAHKAPVMLIITSVLRAGLSRVVKSQIDKDSYDRLLLFVRVLAKPTPSLQQAFSSDCRSAFDAHLDKKRDAPILHAVAKVDDLLAFRFSALERTSKIAIPEGYYEKDLGLAVESDAAESKIVSVLSKVVQLTGFSDEIYAETYVTISHSDIILDILLVNQMEETLQNVTIDLSTSGDLKVNEKPAPINLSPLGFAVAKAGIKVRSTDNGLVFGSISYGITDVQSIILNSIPIDICEYVRPMSVSDLEFRSTWTTLEWENKINVPAINSLSLQQVFTSILDGSHMSCLTPGFGISATGDYLAANMYARSTFGEEILANICLERSPAGVVGHLRLRSKTQGIAVALGDRITEIVGKISRDSMQIDASE
ncbi:Coatomer subunit beta [Paramicrosporidium saccamoebae]|uniref:Coatomer subunit beta n=1 Tax=Paramicrosporidium saccamoebae TaxID=1246581 RepID=A0A2H9TQ55_9FUNG|nr:Coatomer subunit beta [Paramicrosporidium saccamoebae]